MISDLADLYQEIIVDHGKRPRNLRVIDVANRTAEGFNPLCGDRVRVYVQVDGERLADISFTGSGCAICTASASLMTQFLKDRDETAAHETFEQFIAVVTGQTDDEDTLTALGKLAALAGVRKYPVRVKCATLPWHTLEAALQDTDNVVSTE
ncbi:MAG: SUF system NifU family Fe-S cluster assembly protein [Phycisphaerales bacterium]|nr:SUF system NifU family Fe-S cluster assembly protein [Phycisphaerales bacterium]